MTRQAYSKRNWRSACGAARRWYVRDEGGRIVASGDVFEAVMAAARAKRPTGQLTISQYARDGSRISCEPVTLAA